ncbi:hypothetical protein [Burkholderia glumae]|uniref:hypothetical protein n=1 Tax=Burkholderia glumae TaxID=337 RepID=UPI00214F6BB3|nr:hypothetical protein [Burkholderia glumae]
MTTHEKNPPPPGEGQPGNSDREAFSTGSDDPPAATLPGAGGGGNAAQRHAAVLTNEQIGEIAKRYFRGDTLATHYQCRIFARDIERPLLAAPVAEPACATCNGQGMVGSPSFYAPDEGGVPCPDCALAVAADRELTDEQIIDAWTKRDRSLPEHKNVLAFARALLASPQAATATPIMGLLYEHDDGRYTVAADAESAEFMHGSPTWHRLGPVEIHMPLPAEFSAPRAAVPADLTNEQILTIAKHHFRTDHSTAPETLAAYCESVRAVITAYALAAAPAAPATPLVMQPLTDAAMREALDEFELVCENSDVRRLTDDEKYAAQEFTLSLIHGDPSAVHDPAAPVAIAVPKGFAIKCVEGHGWTIDPPSGSRWVAFEGTPAGELIAALLAQAVAAPIAETRAYDGLTEEFIDEIARVADDAPWIRDAVESALESCSVQIVPIAQAVAADGDAADEGREWTGNPDADTAILLLDRLDVQPGDDTRVEQIEGIVRKLASAAAPATAARIAALEAENRELTEFVIAVGGFWGESRSKLIGPLSLSEVIKQAMRETVSAPADHSLRDGEFMVAPDQAREHAAVRTLTAKGYTYHGGEMWKPLLGKLPAFLSDQLRGLDDPRVIAANNRSYAAGVRDGRVLGAAAAGRPDDVQRELRNDVLLGNHDALEAAAAALDRIGADSEAAGVRAVAHALRGMEARLAADLPDSEGGEA